MPGSEVPSPQTSPLRVHPYLPAEHSDTESDLSDPVEIEQQNGLYGLSDLSTDHTETAQPTSDPQPDNRITGVTRFGRTVRLPTQFKNYVFHW